jgi:hypothetical protein
MRELERRFFFLLVVYSQKAILKIKSAKIMYIYIFSIAII